MKVIYLAGGCFWGVEKYFAMQRGVINTEVGYANGNTENPTYEEVCRKNTGHAETVKVEYDENLISLKDILLAYFDVIDPTSINKQGPDIGRQYRTGIYFIDEDDSIVINHAIKELQAQYEEPVVIEVEPLVFFYSAEEYHQKYLDKNPSGYCHIPTSMFKSKK